ncbi:MAG TPA: radical SAM protein [Bacteroidia bacterium]|nr:radical SAM protein [Bacteroidia bacterium]
MNILFTHSYFSKLDPKQFQAQTPYAPLATLYAASYLRQNNYEVNVFDVQFCDSGQDILDTIKKIKPAIFIVYDDGFNYLSKMCLTNMREATFEMQKIAKKQGCTIIVSSSDATDNYEEYLIKGADFIIAGEGEHTLLELVNKLKNKDTDFENVSGLIYKNNHLVCKTPKRQVLKELDELPHPAWDLIDLNPYKKTWLNKHSYFSINFVTTRGCPYKCNWCAKPIYGNRYNIHSPEYVVNLIEDLQSKTNFKHIWFADDIFGLKPGWLKRFADLVEERKLKFNYKIQSRADLLLEEDNIAHLARSGCNEVWMGAESGSQKILDAMDKGITVEQIYTATHLLKKHGIKPALFLQFGYLGETIGDIKLTIQMVNDVMPEEIGISVSYPLPGTVFYERVKQELTGKKNWSDSDDLDLMFENTYSKEFYKQLHRYVHKIYRGNQSLKTFKKLFSFKEQNNKSMKRLFGFPFYFASAYIEKRKLKQLEPEVAKSL